MKCKFCEEEIIQDRYNLRLEWERQDFPNESDWQKSSLFPNENVCGNCFDKITKYIEGFLIHLAFKKGKLI